MKELTLVYNIATSYSATCDVAKYLSLGGLSPNHPPFPSLPSTSLLLEVGPLNSAGYGAEPQLKPNLVHFSVKI